MFKQKIKLIKTTKNLLVIISTSLILSITAPSFSFAYFGPGMGGGLIASVLGIVIAILTLLIGIIWFPIRRLIKSKKKKKDIKKISKSD